MNESIPHASGHESFRGRKSHLLNSTPYHSVRSLGYGLLEIGLGLAVMGAAMVGGSDAI